MFPEFVNSVYMRDWEFNESIQAALIPEHEAHNP